ncbi:hypothetical protein N7523_005898 [Penicillium sp. IBT 18751x]|nr:hypothetical protein N7523_005898 [Penicillium sp. IBT 18751x]
MSFVEGFLATAGISYCEALDIAEIIALLEESTFPANTLPTPIPHPTDSHQNGGDGDIGMVGFHETANRKLTGLYTESSDGHRTPREDFMEMLTQHEPTDGSHENICIADCHSVRTDGLQAGLHIDSSQDDGYPPLRDSVGDNAAGQRRTNHGPSQTEFPGRLLGTFESTTPGSTSRFATPEKPAGAAEQAGKDAKEMDLESKDEATAALLDGGSGAAGMTIHHVSRIDLLYLVPRRCSNS